MVSPALVCTSKVPCSPWSWRRNMMPSVVMIGITIISVGAASFAVP